MNKLLHSSDSTLSSEKFVKNDWYGQSCITSYVIYITCDLSSHVNLKQIMNSTSISTGPQMIILYVAGIQSTIGFFCMAQAF